MDLYLGDLVRVLVKTINYDGVRCHFQGNVEAYRTRFESLTIRALVLNLSCLTMQCFLSSQSDSEATTMTQLGNKKRTVNKGPVSEEA